MDKDQSVSQQCFRYSISVNKESSEMSEQLQSILKKQNSVDEWRRV